MLFRSQQPLLQKLRWLRVIGDSIFALGAIGIGWFVIGLKGGWSLQGKQAEPEPLPEAVVEPVV